MVIKLCISPIDKKIMGRCDRDPESTDPAKMPCCLCNGGENFVKAVEVLKWIRLLQRDGIGSKQTVLEMMENEIGTGSLE